MATRISPPQNKTYYINPAYLTFVENSGYGANLIQVSASSSCYISVYDPANGIGYSDADRNYQRWKVTAYNNKFPETDANGNIVPAYKGKWYIYVRLERSGTSALVVYDQVLRGVKGGEITVSKDEQGNDIYTEAESTQDAYWYIRIGEVGPTDGTSIREITYDTGYLTSDESQNDKDGVNEMWELDKYSTPWLIRAKHWLTSFTLKGFLTLIGGLIFKNNDGVEKPIVDVKRSTDDDVPVDDTTIPTTAYIRSISDDRYLRKYEPDETYYRIKFYDGIEAGHFVKGLIGGAGTQFDGDGYGEMNGLTLREFLEVPELRFNRIDVVSGELWNSIAFGLVEKVDTARRICWIKLEEKERCGLHVYDICRGIFADFGDGTQWEGVDECGFLHLYGFWTAYFTPTEILENGEGVFSFKYELKPGTKQHPTQSMKFAVYGNFIDTSRQASAYSTRTYKRYLNKVDTWVIDPDKHIYAQYGDLNGLTIGKYTMSGYGSFQSNVYITGGIFEFTPQQKLELQGQSAYAAVLSSYEGTVIIDDEGNIIGGDTEQQNVITNGQNVVSGGQNVVTAGYRLRTEVQAMKGETPLFYSLTSPSEGAFAVGIQSVGCTAMIVNGVVVVTSVFYTERCFVNITVNCEGKSSFNLVYNINAVREGRNPVIADIDNEMDSVACDSSGKVLFGLPVSCTVSMWAGVKKLPLDSLSVSAPQGVSVMSDKDTGVVEVTAITDEAERTLPVNITAYATHGDTQYHKDLVFTVNKVNAGENALLYKLSPSASSVKVDDEGQMTATSVTCEVVASDGSNIETLDALPEGVTMKYFIDKESPESYEYNTPVEIHDGNKTVTFQLYSGSSLIDVETIPILLDGSSPVVIDLENEMFSVACDENGEVILMPEISSAVSMYWGSKALETVITEVSAPEGVTASHDGTRVTVSAISKEADKTLRVGVSAKAFYGETEYTRTAYIIINKLMQGNSAMVLDLLPSVSAIKVSNRGVYTPDTVSCRTRMTTGKNGSSVPAEIQDYYTMHYSLDGGSEKQYDYGEEIYTSENPDKEEYLTNDVTFYLYYTKDGHMTLVDKETVPVLRDAAAAFKSTVFKRTNSTPSAPAGGSFDNPLPDDTSWSDGVPSGDAMLWASSRTFTSDGQPPQDDAWSTPAQMTDTATFDVEFSSVESNPGTPDTRPSYWDDYADETTIWMATRTIRNGVEDDWQVSRIKGEQGEQGEQGEKGEDGENAQYYILESSVTSIGYTMTGGYSPSVFTLREYLVNGSSRTSPNTYYIHAYGIKSGEDPEWLDYTGTSREWEFHADEWMSYDYDAFQFQLQRGSSATSSLVSTGTVVTVGVAKQGENGADGADGAAGAMARYRGYWDDEETYVYDSEYRDIVLYKGNTFMVMTFGAELTNKVPPSTATSNTNWQVASSFSFVATDMLLADSANIAGFTFTRLNSDLSNPIGKLESANGKLVLNAYDGSITCNDVDLTGTINATSGTIGGFTIDEYMLVNDGAVSDNYGMTNMVSLTPYDEISISYTSNEVGAMTGGYTSSLSTIAGFTVGIKSEIGTTKDTDGGTHSSFAIAGGFFEGTATSGNRGSIGVWGRAQYNSGSPYILAGVVGTELASRLSSYTKAQAGVIGYSAYNYGVFAQGGLYDLYLKNGTIGNFGFGSSSSSTTIDTGYNVHTCSGTAYLPSISSVPLGRMFIVIRNGSSSLSLKVSSSDSCTIKVSNGESISSGSTLEFYEPYAAYMIIKINSSTWYAFKAYDK